MGYLLTKKAEVNEPSKKLDRETIGDILAGLTAGGGLTASGIIGNNIFKNKFRTGGAYQDAVVDDTAKVICKLLDLKDEGHWFAKHLMKDAPGTKYGEVPTRLGKAVIDSIRLGAGFKNLKWPGKLKALGLVTAPLAAGGLIDAAIN